MQERQLKTDISTDLWDAVDAAWQAARYKDKRSFIVAALVAAVRDPAAMAENDLLFKSIREDGAIGGLIGFAIRALRKGDTSHALEFLQVAEQIIDDAELVRLGVVGPIAREEARLKSGSAARWDGNR